MMRKNLFIFLVVVAPMLLSCGKDSAGDDVTIVPSERSGYVFFGSEVATKTPIISNMNGQTFGVVAFKYTSDWNTFRATGTPASSGPGSVPDGKYGFPCPTIVSCSSGGICTYDASPDAGTQLVEWENGMKYGFFAYYPMASTSPSNGVVMNSSAGTAGTPTLTYSVPSWTDPSKLQDVMTAFVVDVANTGDGTVGLTFKHRLCCIDFEARNFNNAAESVKNLVFNITSPVYTSVNVPMDASIPITPSGNKEGGISYQIIADNDGAKVTVPVIEGSSATTTNLSGDNNVILIPQTSSAKGKLEGSISFTDKNGEAKSETFKSDKDFEAGKKYSFIISFSKESISIAIIESGDWIDTDQNIIFE